MRKTYDFHYDYTGLGRRIQVRRKELGLTQEQMAEKIECSLTHLSRIEGGARPSLESLIRISMVLEYGLDDLTGLHSAKNPYLQELCNLFLSHSSEDQKLALSFIRNFFQIIDYVERKGKKKSGLNDYSFSFSHSAADSDEEPPLETWNCRPV